MRNKHDAGGYFALEVKPDIYLISHEYGEHGVHWGRKTDFGAPSGNSWLIRGSERSLLIDSALPHEGFRAFAERVAGTPVQLVLTHAHYDHVFRLREFDEFWIHPEDEGLLKGRYSFQPAYDGIPKTVHYVKEGDAIDLGGGRKIDVYHTPGHSDGSILLFDLHSRSLFSGDTIARRLLYGLGKWVSLDQFIQSVARFRSLDFDSIYSCHDRSALSKSYLDFMIESIFELSAASGTIQLLGIEFIHLSRGIEREEFFFDMVVPADRRKETAESLRRLRESGWPKQPKSG